MSLKNLGNNIDIAIKRRKLRKIDVAYGANISLPTLRKIIKGINTVSIGNIEAVLIVLDLQHQLYDIACPNKDDIGTSFSIDDLPERINRKRN